MSKIKDIDLLKKCYIQEEMSTNEIAKKSVQIFGFRVTQGTVYNSLVHYGLKLRDKSASTSIAVKKKNTPTVNEFIELKDIIKTKQERWNARWFCSSKEINIKNNLLSYDDAGKLRILLSKYGENWAIPIDTVENEFKKAREEGFPYDLIPYDKKLNDWNNLINLYSPKEDNMYRWEGIESRLATSFHPHFYDGKCKGRMSPIAFFNSDEDLKRGIRKALALYGKITRSNLRVICRDEDASSMITNFPPRVAIAILKDLFPARSEEKLSLLDPCAGFSGRLIGTAASGVISRYVGIDLSPHTHKGLEETKKFIQEQGCGINIELHHADCIKKMAEMDELFDCILTSPPFLDVEEYLDVPFERNYGVWRESFIRPFVQLCFARLKSKGRMAIYSENIAKNKALSNDLSAFAKDSGFLEQNPILFKKTPGAYNRAKNSFKVTAIKVWQKP